MEVGMSQVLFKPLRRETLRASIAKWVRPRNITETCTLAAAAALSEAQKPAHPTPTPVPNPASLSAPVPVRHAILSRRESTSSLTTSDFPVLYRKPILYDEYDFSILKMPRRTRSMSSSRIAHNDIARCSASKLREEVEAAHRKLEFSRKEST